jgi:hypothetical protein
MFAVGKGYVVFIGPAIAALTILRFGLTLPLKSRAIRYGLVVLLVYAALPALSLIVPKETFITAVCNRNCDWSSIGPRGDYALAHYRWRFNDNTKMGVVVNTFNMREADYLVRLSDGEETLLDHQLHGNVKLFWADNDTAFCYSADVPEIRIIRLTPGGQAACSSVRLSGSPIQVLPSSDGSLAIVASRGERGTVTEILDIKAGKMAVPPLQQANACWWESDRKISYIDSAGKRYILQLD